MQIFKLTPTPRSDFRLEINEIRKRVKLEKFGYRHNKIVYGFCDELPDMSELQSLGLTIEEVTFDEKHLRLMQDMIERKRTKSKIEHLKNDDKASSKKILHEQGIAQKKLADLNNNIQTAKEALDIQGTLKVLKF